MSFAWPHLLWLLLLPAGLLGLDLARRRRLADDARPKILRAVAGPRHLALDPARTPVRHRPRWLLALGLAFACLALARPQWGRIEERVFDQSREIIIAVDLSRSMLATDIRPSRLERAKLLIQSLLEKLAGERVGLVVFSGTAFLQSPLSADYEILREFLPILGPDYLPEGGTDYRALLETTLGAFASGSAADRFLIVLSDGESTGGDWKPLLPELRKKNIRTLGLGIGTEAGAMLPDGAGGFIKDERGAVVLSRLESATLRELAAGTDGVYRDAGGWLDLAGLLGETVEAGRKGEFQETQTVRLVERFQWALAPALGFLLLSLWREFPVRPVPRDLRLSPQPAGRATAAKAGAAALVAAVLAGAMPTAAKAAETGAANLGKIVGRLSQLPSPAARDWAELARETVFWGQRLQSGQQPVPAGPVRDALAAVDLGAALEAGAADWPKLREELEALLQKSDEPPPPPENQPQNQEQQKQDRQNQDRQQQDQEQGRPEKEKPSDPQSGSPGEQEQPDAKPDSPGQPPNQPRESAFGDMQQDVPPPPSSETQKVGGAPEPKPGEPAQTDPALAVPLQKLDQLRNQDSPGRLFQLLQGEAKPAPAKGGRNW